MSDDRAAAIGGPPAALLIHGFNGEPTDMAELEQHLAGLGCPTRNLLLPGHGMRPRDLAQTGWTDWSAAVASATAELLERHPRVVLVGHSMGAALALHVAAHQPRVVGVAALCPPLAMYPAAVRFVALGRLITPYLPTLREDVRDPEARLRYTRNAYRWTPLAAVYSLFQALPSLRAELPRVRCRVLVVCARRDHVVPARDGMEVFRLVGTRHKELFVLDQSYHVVTKDVERALVFERVGAFALRTATPARRTQRQRGA